MPSTHVPTPDELETIDPDELHDEPDVLEPAPDVPARPQPTSSPSTAATTTQATPEPTPEPAPKPKPKPAPSPAPSFAELAPTAYADDSFEVPTLRRSRGPLVLVLLLVAIVLGGGGAYLYMKSDDKAPQVAQPTAEPDASVAQSEVDAAVVAAVTVDAAEPAPEIEIEPEPVASEPAPDVARKTPRRGRSKTSRPDRAPPPDDTEPAQPEPDTEPAAPKAVPGCEEVECVMEGYKRACCARFKPAGDGFKPSTVPAENLQKPQIKAGIAKVRAKVMACGEQFPTKGTVKLSISVDPEGQITELDVVASPDDGLGSCVAAAVRMATFAKTEAGGSFTQPFVF